VFGKLKLVLSKLILESLNDRHRTTPLVDKYGNYRDYTTSNLVSRYFDKTKKGARQRAGQPPNDTVHLPGRLVSF